MSSLKIRKSYKSAKTYYCFLLTTVYYISLTFEHGNNSWGNILTSERISDSERQIFESNPVQSFRGHIFAVEQVRQRSVQLVVHFTTGTGSTGTAGAACSLIVAIDFGGSAA
jgi:hypothetical protein